MLSFVLWGIGIAVVVCGLASLFTRRLPLHKINGLMCLANSVIALGGVVDGSPVSASMSAGFAAVSGWLWWKGGGGDDTKRRLRTWARRFQGVRRTAPSAA
ncbi:hypothetical protein D0Z67_29335 (plasmid) [Streptomyces seoulensis]|uniref:Uncharacterized protein n=1 Tax=Streptomyces seoulensis TaxID=73044 RepID=A0A4P6U5Q7_STRSO|nr:hypothetical protein D0Z67_29335 [Streptomyces seoulensis]